MKQPPSTNIRINAEIWDQFRKFCRKQGMSPRVMLEIQMKTMLGQADNVFKVLDRVFEIGEAAGRQVLKVNKTELSKLTKKKY